MVNKIVVTIDAKEHDLDPAELDEYMDAVEMACLDLAGRAHVSGGITIEVRDATEWPTPVYSK